jgi:hypothetical protein
MHVLTHSGFGGLVPKIAGSIPAKAVGFFGQKKSTPCLPSEEK